MDVMSPQLDVSLLGELTVSVAGQAVTLPASRKARALLGFLVATGRPHRRERLCELFWDQPDDPKASLRWALSKLRKAVDTPDRPHIMADRERVYFVTQGPRVDLQEIHRAMRENSDRLPLADLEAMALSLRSELLDGLDTAGDEAFANWLTAERNDAEAARSEILKRILSHPDLSAIATRKWMSIWQSFDPIEAGKFNNKVARRTASKASAETDAVVSKPSDTSGPSPEGSAAERLNKARAGALRAQKIGFCEATDGTKIAYATIGSGAPILKAANWLNHLEFDWASPIWGQSFAALARHRRFIRYDERGCGLSDWSVDNLSFDAFVEDLEAVADKLGLERFPLIGISQGCAVSIEYAVRHPERVSGLILISGYAAGWRHMATPEEQAQREAVLTLTKLGWGTDNPAYRHIFSKTFMPDATAEDLDWFDEFQRQTTSPANASRFQNAFGLIDVRHRLNDVSAPTIVFHSRHDQRIPLDQGRALADGIKDAQFVPLESRNHILVDREPALKVCLDTIDRFLDEHGI